MAVVDDLIAAKGLPPNPGSDEARRLGCICAVLDNSHGRGDGPFWITEGCPVHAPHKPDDGSEDGGDWMLGDVS